MLIFLCKVFSRYIHSTIFLSTEAIFAKNLIKHQYSLSIGYCMFRLYFKLSMEIYKIPPFYQKKFFSSKI